MIENKVIGRFAPSPSGRMHIGNVMCALIAWLSVRSKDGHMILRIEDLDRQRCTLARAQMLEDDLRWLGLDWDSGGIEHACMQSKYDEYYKQACDMLIDKNLVYKCFCTRAELHAQNAPHTSDGIFLYSGACRNLTDIQIEEKSQIRNGALRLCVPDMELSFTDGIYGQITENLARDTGDFILQRSDGIYAYQLAVTVDDGRMGINEVVRGCDLLSSTARQIYLHEQLGYKPPSYTHIPLLCAPDGRRLSKRDADLDLGTIRKKANTPEKLIGQLAYLCGIIDKKEAITARELIPLFDIKNIYKENIVLDEFDYNSF